ncbi:segregation and condensation protein B [Desulfosarcina widdelii]|uniref:Segregation and condensation protein B n=1 Tax=Desulfosarcina widdelii TaxID=947919 RepID=A0A5K7YZU8_9BACT|nr:SMC-Scp complex subunit ScpB [Desulfosarcina widdelii]BBO73920.1 segregation and condensation protein B [Desulfosarcina widdelii]
MTEDLKYIIESLLFVSETPLTMDQLKNILEGEETAAIRDAVDDLIAEYGQRNGGFVLKQVAGGYQFRTQGRYNEWIKRLIRPNAPRLSKAALETLAIIAYNQPIIRSDIEHIRGVDSGGVIRMLMDRKLIRVLGRKEIPGRPLIYATTKHFLEVFELKDLKDLPTPKEIEELSHSRLDEESENQALTDENRDVSSPSDDGSVAEEEDSPPPSPDNS